VKILLFGKNGQLGWELQRALAPLGQVIPLDRHGLKGLTGDLSDSAGLTATIRALQPDILVNAAAYTAVDRAETERELAWQINAAAPRVMAEVMAQLDGWLIQYSTDYVFDGSGNRPWSEDDPTTPVNTYGETKLAGESAVREAGGKHLILRTSWSYSRHGSNFLKTVIRLGAQRSALQIVHDQIGAPTGTDLIADVTAHLLRAVVRTTGQTGTYHLACAGETSWYDYACFIIATARTLGIELSVETVEPIFFDSYRTAARRPLNSRLETAKLRRQFDLHLPDWQEGVLRTLTDIKGQLS